MELLDQLKDFVWDRPFASFFVMAIAALVYMFRKYDRAQNARVEMVQELAPLADKLCRVIERLGVHQKKPGECRGGEVR